MERRSEKGAISRVFNNDIPNSTEVRTAHENQRLRCEAIGVPSPTRDGESQHIVVDVTSGVLLLTAYIADVRTSALFSVAVSGPLNVMVPILAL